MHFAEIAGAFVGSARPPTSRLVPPSSVVMSVWVVIATPLPIGPATTPGRSVAIGGRCGRSDDRWWDLRVSCRGSVTRGG